jgi:WD40 repeat protein
MIGKSIGHYAVTAHLGSGGMGDVYCATDSKLGRQVAIKLLPDALAREPERQARLEREARVLASLNHPNIAAIHGIEESGGSMFLVMELVPGETLAERIARGPIPLRDALAMATQIADALDAAHQRGIIHRDLKPANIKITPDGKVKVLDFGLAKAFEGEASPSNLSHSPTLSLAATQAGMILGTAGYMSPEQARGRTVDKRSDVWSFGCVLFEMLTGRQIFSGETVSDTLARILEREPDWDSLPAATPASIRRLLRRSLQKDARKRLHDIADARIEIDEALTSSGDLAESPASPASRRFIGVAVSVAVALVAATALLTMLVNRPAPSTRPLMRFPVLLPKGEVADGVAVSPDGRTLAVVSIGPRASVWLRSLDAADPRQVPGTEGTREVFWSADGRRLAVLGPDRRLRSIDLAGGSPVVLAEGVDTNGSWSAEGVILFSGNRTIRGVSSASGAAVDVQLEDGADSKSWRGWPRFLPDGRHFLYFLQTPGQQGTICVGSLGSKETRSIAPADSGAEYSTAGYLLFVRGAVLMAQAFDARTLTLSGEAIPIAADAASGSLSVFPNFSAPVADTLAYVRTRGGNDGQLRWFDRSGREIGSIVPPEGSDYLNPSLSPDGTRVAVNNMDPHSGNWDVWVIDLESKIPIRVTSDPAQDSDAIWSPDSNEVVFVSNRGGTFALYRKRLRGTAGEELLLKTADEPRPTDWTDDGRFIVYELNRNVYALPLTGADRSPVPVAESEFNEYGANASADGRWIAYASDESGAFQVYIQSFPKAAEKIRVSTVYGIHPRWRRDGRELVYWQPPDALRSVELRYDSTGIHAGPPTTTLPPNIGILDVVDSRHHYAMSADGQRFLLRQAAGPPGPPVNVVVNWTEALRQ